MIARSSQQGYILLLNIAVLALLLLGATYMGRQMSVVLDMAQAEQAEVAGEAHFADARARVMFLYAALPRTLSGLGLGAQAIIPDGRFYRMEDGVLVSFQDVRGLVSVNGIRLSGVGRINLERLIETYGVDHDTAMQLTDALLDYRDSDDLRRLNGAEKEEYARLGQVHLLRNNDLILPSELARVYGWADVAALWDGKDPVSRHVNTYPRPVFNPNFASWRAIVAMSGVSEELAKSLVQSRQQGAVADITPLVFGTATGNPFSAGPLILKLPSENFIVTLYQQGLPVGYRFSVVHTPIGPVAPWRIEYSERLPVPDEVRTLFETLKKEPEQIPLLPQFAVLNDPVATGDSKQNQVQFPFLLSE